MPKGAELAVSAGLCYDTITTELPAVRLISKAIHRTPKQNRECLQYIMCFLFTTERIQHININICTGYSYISTNLVLISENRRTHLYFGDN